MNFEAIFNYQDIDRELYKIENEIMNSKEMKDVSLAKSAIADATESIRRLNADACEAFNQFEKNQSELTALQNKVAEIEQLDLATNDMGSIEFYEKKLNELTDKSEYVKKEFDKIVAKCDIIKANYEKTSQLGMRYYEALKKATEQLNAFKRLRMESAASIKEQLEKLKSEIKPELIALYESRRNNKKLPAFVRYDTNHQDCVCGMDLPNNCIQKLKVPGDYTECPNCTRILIITD